MSRTILAFVVFSCMLPSCTQRMICPAYQSAFIYDKDELRKKFSYFESDTIPKVFTASKNKYLVAEQMSYRRKVRTLQSVPAKKVMVNVPDSLSGGQKTDSLVMAQLDSAARTVIDSTVFADESREPVATEDSAYVITRDREVRVLKYNMPDSLEYDSASNRYVAQKPAYYVEEVRYKAEQDSYMWYLRHSLVLPDVRLAKLQGGKKDASGQEARPKEKRGLKGFFRNLFRKKQPEDIDSAELDLGSPEEHEFDFIDTTAQVAPDETPQPRQKKGLLNARKGRSEELSDDSPADKPSRKKKKKSDKPQQAKDDKKKPEDEDDGF